MIKTVIQNIEGLLDWFTPIPSKLSLDTETTSLNYFDLDCIGISLCDGERACYVNLEALPLFVAEIGKLLPQVQKLIFHNAPFDMKVLHKLSIKHTSQIYCTMTAAHLIDENQSKHLKELAEKYLRVQTQSYEEAIRQGSQSSTFFQYAINDAIWTWKLHEIFTPLLKEEGVDKLFFDTEMPFQFVLRDMEIYGIQVDANKLHSLQYAIMDDIQTLYLEVLHAGEIHYTINTNLLDEPVIDAEINIDSPEQLSSFIRNRLGIELILQTNDGHYIVDKHVLKGLIDTHPFFEKLSQYRELVSLYDKFLSKLPNYIDGDNRIRANFHNTVVVTGRLSSSKPNLQQLPTEDTWNIRSCFVASEGRVLVGADYDGQELRGLAHESIEPTMIDAFYKGKDLHLTIANEFFALDIPEPYLFKDHPKHKETKAQYKEYRDKAKIVNFGLAYGKTAYGFAKDWHISKREANEFIETYFQHYPKIKQSIVQCNREVDNKGYVTNIADRKRRFKCVSNKSYRQAFNFKIQGMGADMLRIACNLIRSKYKEHPEWNAHIILLVHDEIVTECKEEYANEVKRCMQKCMINAMELIVPLEANIKIGKKYSEVH